MLKLSEIENQYLDGLTRGFDLETMDRKLGFGRNKGQRVINNLKNKNKLSIYQLVARYVREKVRAEYEQKDMVDPINL